MKVKKPPLPVTYEFSCGYLDRPDKTRTNTCFKRNKSGCIDSSLEWIDVQNDRCFHGNSRDKYVSIDYCTSTEYGGSIFCDYLVVKEVKK